MVLVPGSVNLDEGFTTGDLPEGGEPVPEAIYTLRIDKAEISRKPGKHPYLKIQCVVTDEGEYLGRRIFDGYSFSPKSLWRLRNFLDQLGFDKQHRFEGPDDVATEVIEREAKASVVVEKGGPVNAEEPEGDHYPDRNKIAKWLR